MELQHRANARTGRGDSARHAHLILLLADGLTWAEIRAKLDCSDSYIDRWSKRFAADRLAGLFARPAGRERYRITDRIEARVLARTTKHKPTDGYSSWLNQVELWFSKIERDVIARGVFTSVPGLKSKLMRYIRKYNEQPKPVKWKYLDPTRRITASIVTAH